MGKQQKKSDSTTEQVNIHTEEELMDLAKKELLRDIKCASMRAEQFGAHSWAKPQKYVPSKRFLRHMLVSASRENHRKSDKLKEIPRITSAMQHHSPKNDHSTHKKRSTKRRQSRWDSSPQEDKTSPLHKKVTTEDKASL